MDHSRSPSSVPPPAAESEDLEARLARIEAELRQAGKELAQEGKGSDSSPDPGLSQRPEVPESRLDLGEDPDPDGSRHRKVLEAAQALKREIDQVRKPLGQQGLDRRSALGMMIPMQMVSGVAVGALLGSWLDKTIGNNQGGLTLLGLALGVAASIRLVMRTYRDMNRP